VSDSSVHGGENKEKKIIIIQKSIDDV